MAARRRAAGSASGSASGSARRVGVGARLVVLGLVGMLLAIAFHEAVRSRPDLARTRVALVRDVRQRAQVTDRLQREDDRLRAQLASEQARLLADSTAGAQATARAQQRAEEAALVPVRGPGIVVEVGDARHEAVVPGQQPAAAAQEAKVVSDHDLQDLVNALWQAGAEAISVNDQRLSPGTAIRSAGSAVLVDFRPVSSPYRIRAIGNPNRLDVAFVGGSVGRAFATYRQVYGLTFAVSRAGRLSLPSAAQPLLRFATPGPSPDVTRR